MVGIALILDPSKKKQYLTKFLGWLDDWVDCVMEQFTSSFHFYLEKSKEVTSSATASIASIGSLSGGYGNYAKRRRIADRDSDEVEEFERYFNAPLPEEGTDVLLF